LRWQDTPNESVLQLTYVYGELTPKIIQTLSPTPLHIADVAVVQLSAARSKPPSNTVLLAARMNAEKLAYKDDRFSTIVLFFLLHEMPEEARANVLLKYMRVIPAGGALLMTEYASLPTKHILYRFSPSRWLITYLEPFLDGFWRDDVESLLNLHGKAYGKTAVIASDERIFADFYRVTEFRIN